MLGSSFIILMLVFRSIVIPIKAIIMNLLSVGATYGLLVLVFQRGVGTDLLGFQHAEVIDAWIPLFLFSILFGLSMDYHVFLLSRIRERYDETGGQHPGGRLRAAVDGGDDHRRGAHHGSGVRRIRCGGDHRQPAGRVRACDSGILGRALVRSILVPASMDVLGKGNWYLPSWLQWLPNLRVESEEA